MQNGHPTGKAVKAEQLRIQEKGGELRNEQVPACGKLENVV